MNRYTTDLGPNSYRANFDQLGRLRTDAAYEAVKARALRTVRRWAALAIIFCAVAFFGLPAKAGEIQQSDIAQFCAAAGQQQGEFWPLLVISLAPLFFAAVGFGLAWALGKCK
jgi:H+/Cl- antiporter ClcA